MPDTATSSQVGLAKLWCLWTTLLLAVAVLLPAQLHAEGRERTLSDYTITSWTAKDGIPSSVIWSLAQDPAGYLWLGTNEGLARFDGVEFRLIQSIDGQSLPAGGVRSVFTGRDGSLWIGFTNGDISRLRDGHVQTYNTRAELSPGLITGFVEDRAGTIWAGSYRGLLSFTGDRWKQVGTETNLPKGRIDAPYVDRKGNLFVGSEIGVFRRAPGQRFELVDRTNVSPKFRSFAEDAKGQLWVSDPVQGFRRITDPPKYRRTASDVRGNRVLFDRSGVMWVATMDQGIWLLNPDAPQQIEHAPVPGARSILEDRDGNIWAGTGQGLYRLAHSQTSSITGLGPVTAAEAATDGSVWVSTTSSVLRFTSGQIAHEQPMLKHVRVCAMHADRFGSVWIATDSMLLRFQGERHHAWPLSALGLAHVTAITSNAQGGLWIADRERGVFRGSAREDVRPLVRVTTQTDVNSAYVDSQGRVWLGVSEGYITMLTGNGRAVTYKEQEGIDRGTYEAIFEDHQGDVWVGSVDGLFLWRGERFINRGRQGGYAISEDDAGNLWLATRYGVECLRRTDIESASSTHGSVPRGTVLDGSDGLAGMPIWFHSRGVARAMDGRLWFVTGSGLSVINPHLPVKAQVLSQPNINQLLANEKPLALSNGVIIPAGTNRLQIDYSALQLNVTHPVHFRYRLDGFDNGWIEANSHRQAVYTHLPPGHYVFELMASNTNGTWSPMPATWAFAVGPAFYQTPWFYCLCIILAVVCIWGAARVHAHRIHREFSAKLSERMRLSRELHDTLLQSLVAVTLHFNAAAESLDPCSPVHRQLVRIRKEVERDIREARQCIQGLRSPVLMNQDLITALRSTMDNAVRDNPVRGRMTVQGKPFQASAMVEQQLLRIGQEAILNAVRHAQASELKVALSYEKHAIKLRVADDGCGFTPSSVAGDYAGHYGLKIMEERAVEVAGALKLTTAIHAGTVIEAVIPATRSRQEAMQ